MGRLPPGAGVGAGVGGGVERIMDTTKGQSSMSTETNKSIARRFFDAACSGDVDTVAALLADDATWWVPRPFGERIAPAAGVTFPAAGVVTGRDAILSEFVGPVMSLFRPGSLSLHVQEVIAEGDKVVVLLHIDADVAKGGSYNNDYSLLLEIRDGRVQSVKEYLDTLYAVGVLAGN